MAPSQTLGCDVDPQASEIPQRRLTNQLRELIRKCGTRERHTPRERSDRPGLGWVGMKQRESPADLLIANCSQPSEFRTICIFFEVRTDSLNKQDVGQSSNNLRRASASRVQFFHNVFECQPKPGAAGLLRCSYMEEGWKHSQEGVGSSVFKLHSAAHQPRQGAFASTAKDSVPIRVVL